MSKILLFDIENTPIVTYAWGIHEEPTHSTKFVKKDWMIMCWAAKWLGSKKIITANMWGKKDDKVLLDKLWGLLDEADIVVAHNGRKFDIRKANARFIQHGMTPPSPYKTVDTLISARKSFMFTSNRLGDLGQYLGCGKKIDTGGFDLWLDCMAGKKSAQAKMMKYCIGDVKLLEKVYLKLLPYMKTHPTRSIYDRENLTCPKCGSGNVQKRGTRAVTGGLNQEFKCLDCGGWAHVRIKNWSKRERKSILKNG